MIVLDASALVDAVLHQERARWVLDQMVSQEVVAPAHQPAEVLSALTRLERAGALTPDDARAALDSAASLPQEVVPLDAPLLRRAYELRGRLRVLDALYVSLAERLGAPLLTTDRRLVGAAPPCDVLTPEA